jgi:hypothetical protein
MANVVPSSPIFVTLMMEAIRSPETSVLTRAIRRNIPEDGILRKLGMITNQFSWEPEFLGIYRKQQVIFLNHLKFIPKGSDDGV